MKLLRYGAPGAERPGILDSDGGIRDLSGVVDDVDGVTLHAESLARLADLDIAGSCRSSTPRYG